MCGNTRRHIEIRNGMRRYAEVTAVEYAEVLRSALSHDRT
jgi:hypothetical protein